MTHTTATEREESFLGLEAGFGLLCAILLAVLAVRVFGLAISSAELYFDEAQYWAWGQELGFGYFTKPPLIAWLIRGATEVCGDSPFCVRLPAPIIHLATSLLIYATAVRLFDRRTAFFSALVFNLMPGTSLSATLMSTDVPLLFFWTLGLYAIVRHVERPSLGAGLLLGVALGLGLNAKYAMAFLPGCFVLYALVTPQARPALRHPGSLLALAVALLLIAPNLWWNYTHSFATFEHTGENADWGSIALHPVKLAEFVATQFGIIGPIVGCAFVLALAGRAAGVADFPRRLLLFHSVPVWAAISAQALMVKANGNWAATAFPAAVILATAAMLAFNWRRGMIATFVISAVALAGMVFAGAAAGRFTYGPLGRELSKLVGWGDLAAKVRGIAANNGIGTVVLAYRPLTSSMLYELRDSDLDVRALLLPGERPSDHFTLTRPWRPDRDAAPVLLIIIGDRPVPSELAARATRLEVFPTTATVARHDKFLMTAYRID